MKGKYRIRIVKCKTCGVDVDYLDGKRSGRVIPENGVMIKNLVADPGEIKCPKCGEMQYYKGEDVETIIAEDAAVTG